MTENRAVSEPRRVTVRQFRRELRTFGRALALEDALRAMSACKPSVALDDSESSIAYREQITRRCDWFARSHRAIAARKPTP